MVKKHGGARAGAGRKPGKVSKAKRELMAMAKDHAEMALATLVEVAMDTEQMASARVSAANAILDRGYGRPVQGVDLRGAGKDGEHLATLKIEYVAKSQD